MIFVVVPGLTLLCGSYPADVTATINLNVKPTTGTNAGKAVRLYILDDEAAHYQTLVGMQGTAPYNSITCAQLNTLNPGPTVFPNTGDQLIRFA